MMYSKNFLKIFEEIPESDIFVAIFRANSTRWAICNWPVSSDSDICLIKRVEYKQEQEAKIIENTVESVSGVYDATCKLTTNTELETNIELNIITEEYEEVNINGI